MKKLYLSLLAILAMSTFYGQNNQQSLSTQGSQTAHWVSLMKDPNASFYDVQEAFYTYWEGRTIERGQGYKVFKRWEHYMKPRVYPSGNMTQPSLTYENYKNWERTAVISTDKSVSGDWQLLGPVGKPVGGGAGRLNFVRFDPNNSNTIYVGAPDGGLWKSTNAGGSWTSNTDQLAVIGCTDIAINPNNTQIMYLATGDGDAGDSYSVGVLKSTDGGASWNTTGLSWTASQGRTISRLLIDPTNTNVLLAATSSGIMRSSDAGATWSTVSGGSYKDIEFKPGDPNTVYAAGTTFRKSVNNGASWSTITSGLATSNVERISIAVTEANPAYVYLLFGEASSQGLLGVYRSTDSGTTFSQRDNGSQNLLGWSSSGNGGGGQAFYDLTIAASPTNANEILVGGINVWRSTNGGTSWSINAHWTGTNAPEIHADQHDIQFLPGSGTTYFAANDGGIFKTSNSGTSWTDLSSNLAIAQQYRLGLSSSNETLIITGHQDNGTNRMSGSTWTNVYGGDGMDCFIDRTNNNIMVGSYVYGEYYRSTNGGNSFTDISSGLPSGDWLSVIHQDPVNANTYYAGGRTSLYKTTNAGTSWSALGTPSNSYSIIEFAIAPSNNQVIYAVVDNAVYKSSNGGNTWTNISSGLPVSSVSPTNVAVSNTDANLVFVTFSGYSASSKVYRSSNGGTSWTGISSGLPNLPCNTIVYQNGSAGNAVYVGTDVGVYYKDDNMASWTMYSTNLPRVAIRDLEIYYPTGRIRAATYGRGTWDSDLYSNAAAPVADFTPSSTTVCAGQTVTFTNTTTGGATAYEWTFAGGTPASSTVTNPTVTYNSPGTYQVKLVAINGSGSDTLTMNNLITVTSGQALPFNEGFVTVTFPPANWDLTDLNSNGTWSRTTDAGNIPTATSSVVFDNYNTDDRGTGDELMTPRLNLSTVMDASLSFDVAYAPYDAVYFDSLEVLISSDCGQNFSSIYLKSGTILATAPAVAASFTPAANEWRTETIDLTGYVGNSNVIISFVNRSGYGNRIFLDNINVSGTAGTIPSASFTSSGNNICAGQSITYTSTSTNNPTNLLWSFPGGTPSSSTSNNPVVSYPNGGTFSVELIASNNFGSDTMTLTNSINVSPLPSTPASITGPAQVCELTNGITYSISAVANASSYTWTVPNGSTIVSGQGSTSITVNFGSNSGNVSVTGNNACGSGTAQSLAITLNSIASPTITASGPTSFCTGGSVTLSSSSANNNTWSTGQTTQSIVVSTSGSYTVTVDQLGCSEISAPTLVTVNAIPNISSGALNNPSSCGVSDGSITINGSGSTGTLSWSGESSGSMNNVSLPQTITGLSAGNYSISFNDGCASNSLSAQLVNPGAPATPTISASGSTTFCSGSSVTLTSSSAFNNTWSTGETTQSIVVTAGGDYSVTVTNATCFAISDVINITVNSLPNVSLGAIPTLCNTAASITLNQGTPTGGTYSGNGVSGTTFDPALANLGANQITYTFTNGNGCSNTATATATVTNCSSLEEASANGFVIYPNPTNDFLILKGDKLSEFKRIELQDMNGKMLSEWKLSSNEITLDLSSFSSGNYNLIISGEQQQVIQKIQIID